MNAPRNIFDQIAEHFAVPTPEQHLAAKVAGLPGYRMQFSECLTLDLSIVGKGFDIGDVLDHVEGCDISVCAEHDEGDDDTAEAFTVRTIYCTEPFIFENADGLEVTIKAASEITHLFTGKQIGQIEAELMAKYGYDYAKAEAEFLEEQAEMHK